MLIFAAACLCLSPLGSAQLRYRSSARRELQAALESPEASALRLAGLIAAEECDEAPPVLEYIESEVARLAAVAKARVDLLALLGNGQSQPIAIATAVSTTLFGSGAPDDRTAEPFFQGTAQADYYDPANSYLDCVLRRRFGIPITLSLVYVACCERLGLPMVGLNAPSHLLVAPADKALPFVIDPFDGGKVHDLESASTMVAENAGMKFDYSGGTLVGGGNQRGRILLESLRRRPMTGHAWAVRILRNLRAIHARNDDLVRTLGCAERLRLVGNGSPGVTSSAEMTDCDVQVAYCLWKLRWDERREEARNTLQGLVKNEDVPAADRRQLEELLDDAWFK